MGQRNQLQRYQRNQIVAKCCVEVPLSYQDDIPYGSHIAFILIFDKEFEDHRNEEDGLLDVEGGEKAMTKVWVLEGSHVSAEIRGGQAA